MSLEHCKLKVKSKVIPVSDYMIDNSHGYNSFLSCRFHIVEFKMSRSIRRLYPEIEEFYTLQETLGSGIYIHTYITHTYIHTHTMHTHTQVHTHAHTYL